MRLFDIQRFSVHDGPGIRTSVFLKGCPLRCVWCHNPESAASATQILYYEDKCVMCGRCAFVCPGGAHKTDRGVHIYERTLCGACGKCAEACPHGALQTAGYDICPDELLKIILRDHIFYEQTGGGVTFTGGEPLMQADELKETAKLAKRSGMHTAVETSLFAPEETIEALTGCIDLWICDVKAYPDDLHKRCTGVGNKLILENFRRMSEKIPERMWARIPVVPGFNDSEENFVKIADMLRGKPYGRVELMPYHDMGAGKYAALGAEYALQSARPPEGGLIRQIRDIMKRRGVDVYLPD